MNRINLLIISLFFLHCECYTQFKYNIGLGSGLYFTGQSAVYDNSQKYFTGQLRLNYSYKEAARRASIQLFALPEFFGKDDLVKSLKLKIDADYSEVLENLSWGVSLSKKNYFYNGLGINNSFDIYIFQSFIDWKIGTLPVKSLVGFAYQDISGALEQNSDLIYMNNSLFHYFDNYTQLSLGIYLERFSISSALNNTGWRIGPSFALNYLKDYIFDLQIKFVLHSSKVTSDFSNETILQLIAGKLLTRDLTLFIMTDYSWRNLNYTISENTIPYSLIDSENNINIKLGYNLSRTSEVYIKGGYFNQDFLERDLSLKGWNIIAGFKFGN